MEDSNYGRRQLAVTIHINTERLYVKRVVDSITNDDLTKEIEISSMSLMESLDLYAEILKIDPDISESKKRKLVEAIEFSRI